MAIHRQDRNTPLDEALANVEILSAMTQKIKTDDLAFLSLTERTMRAMDETNHALKEGPCLILYLASRFEPVKLWTKSRITIGRNDKSRQIYPTLDLSNDYGLRLGISRLHAEIYYYDSRYHIRDLGSTNGTWVNGERVLPPESTPIEYGDSIRLGHMVIQVG